MLSSCAFKQLILRPSPNLPADLRQVESYRIDDTKQKNRTRYVHCSLNDCHLSVLCFTLHLAIQVVVVAFPFTSCEWFREGSVSHRTTFQTMVGVNMNVNWVASILIDRGPRSLSQT